MKRKRNQKNKYYLNPAAVLDLHGFTKKEAQAELFLFLEEVQEKGFKKIKIITGQGWHNSNFQSILKPFIEDILEEENYSYTDAKINDGGRGALIVNL
jgi:DNA-nicking Smr family endonuclease